MKAADEKEQEAQKTSKDQVTRWLKELDAADDHEKEWRERADKIVNLYKDERKEKKDEEYRFNILFANTEVLKGAMYSQVPTPDIRRRFLDKDPVARIGALILTRAVSTAMDLYDFDGMMKDAVQDMCLPGRGVSRVKYKPTIVNDDVVYEAVECCYVEWKMFRYSPAKRWEKVRWVAYGELLTRDDMVKQFGSDIGNKVSLKHMPVGMEDTAENAIFKRGLVWTIYNKTERKMIVVSDGYEEAPLKEETDPLGLESFFPSCRPLYAICTTDSLIPTPEYAIYQDHARQLDELNERIAVLTDALRRRGVYDASIPELAGLAKANDNEFVPVKSYREFAEKGGLESAFEEMDISMLAKTLAELMLQSEAKKAQIYEIIGIADIMRGATEAQETLGAQELKSEWGNVRIGPRQGDVQRFARDNVRLMAEVIAEHFSPQTLAQMTGVQLFFTEQEKQQATMAMQPQPGMPPPDDPRMKRPTWEEVMKVLKSDHLRGFRIDIETDSTIKPEADNEQKNRIEAVTALTGFFEKTLPAVQQGMVPQKLVNELAGFALRAFKAGPQLEEILEEWTGGVDQDQNNETARLQQENAQFKARAEEMKKQGEMLQSEQAKMAKEREALTAAEQTASQQAMQERQRLSEENQKLALREMQQKAVEDAENMKRDYANNEQAQASKALMSEINGLIDAHQREIEFIIKEAQQTLVLERKQMDLERAAADKAQKDDEKAQEREDKKAERAALPDTAEIMAGVTEQINASNEVLTTKLAALLTAPKRIVRDKTGRAEGVETVI